MKSLSNPTSRVIAVLNALSEDPRASFSLTELSRDLGISMSTLHAVTSTLVDAHYVIRRESDLRLSAGPALIPLGHAALGDFVPYVDVARAVMRRLSRAYGSHCILTVVIEERVVPVASVGEPQRIVKAFREGQSARPLIPPLGSLFVAWRSDVEVDAWLGRADPPLTDGEIAYYRQALEATRTLGFAAAVKGTATSRLDRELEDVTIDHGLATPPRHVLVDVLREMRGSGYLVTDFDGDSVLEIDWVAAPIFDELGRMIMSLVLLNFPSAVTTRELGLIGARVREFAQEITFTIRSGI